jgi:ABC-type bacteriocin/lantibiotic exporter with double-glycine peptidase domain
MVLEFHGKVVSEEELVNLLETDPQHGTVNEKFTNACRQFGFDCVIQQSSNIDSIKDFLRDGLPSVVNYRTLDKGTGHFAVVVGFDSTSLVLNDPNYGKDYRISFEEFQKHWISGDGRHKSWIFALRKK